MLTSNVRPLLLLAIIIIVTGIFGGCKTSTSPDSGGTTTQSTVAFGQVTDETGTPIAGATVISSTVSGITDANGYFKLDNVSVPSARCVVKASKNG